MKYLVKEYNNFPDLYKDFTTIETNLTHICIGNKQMDDCIKDLKEEAKQIMEQ